MDIENLVELRTSISQDEEVRRLIKELGSRVSSLIPETGSQQRVSNAVANFIGEHVSNEVRVDILSNMWKLWIQAKKEEAE